MNKHNFKMTYTDGALTRIELPNGYVSPEGIRYYVRDYQDNIRQVVDSVGTVLQENHYYPFGMLMGESSDIIEANRFGRWADAASNPYRYSGNRLLTLRNAHIGDFNARWYDFQTCRFITPDPFREKYYSLNHYLYCAGNPIMMCDRTGALIKINGTAQEKNHLSDLISIMKGSEIFNTVYQTLNNSPTTYNFCMGIIDKDRVNKGLPDKRGKKEGTTITLSSQLLGMPIENGRFTLGEETYHLYQDEVPDESGENIEFEAKTVAIMELSQLGGCPDITPDLVDWISYLIDIEDDKSTIPISVFRESYVSNGSSFVTSNQDNESSYYKTPVNQITDRLLNIISRYFLPE